MTVRNQRLDLTCEPNPTAIRGARSDRPHLKGMERQSVCNSRKEMLCEKKVEPYTRQHCSKSCVRQESWFTLTKHLHKHSIFAHHPERRMQCPLAAPFMWFQEHKHWMFRETPGSKIASSVEHQPADKGAPRRVAALTLKTIAIKKGHIRF
ncbi:hypothetical protein TNCV_281491 [Trichonephila clavipes]|nr:hypothetical protein TNCV_281491 [Trichonephila clavipes]